MSRVARKPVLLPQNVEVSLKSQNLSVKGPLGQNDMIIHNQVEVTEDAKQLKFEPKDGSSFATAITGTMRSIVQNMIQGVTEGFQIKLIIAGVGYRAELKGNQLMLVLGYSHAVYYPLPEHVTIEVPKLTEVVIKGTNKQLVGQVAAKIRSFRPVEPYKGKGIRYENETVIYKEAKKK